MVSGYRGRALLILGVLDSVYALGLTLAACGKTPTPAFQFASEALPGWLLALCWWVVAGLCFAYAFRLRDALAWSAAIFVKVFWGVLSGVGWLLGEIPRGYIAVGIWWAFASLVWLISTWPEVRASGNRNNGPEVNK